jgi:iron complex transport system ATP-binding protein
MLMKVENLSCGYGSHTILQGVNLSLREGELWCILGPNGVGKTTLFKTVLGLLKKQKGEIFLKGKPMEQWRRSELAQVIAYVPQSHIPPFPFKVLDVVLMGRNPHLRQGSIIREKDIDAAFTALEMLHIEYLYDTAYTQISGGERQLVLFARAIAQDTPILVLDEPVSNLDFGNHHKVIEYIRDIVKMGKTVIMTTHFPDHAFLPESHVMLLRRDKGFVEGKGDTVLTEEVLKEMYQIDSRIVDLKSLGHEQKVCISIHEK